MTTLADAGTDRAAMSRIDRFGVVIASLLVGALALPFATARATRIASGTGLRLYEALPATTTVAVLALLAATIGAAAAIGPSASSAE